MRGDVLRSIRILTVFYIGLFGSCQSGYAPDDEILSQLPETIDYNLHVKPILSDRCYRCHGPDKNARKADLRLDTKDGLFNEARTIGNHQPIQPGKPNKSELISRITSDDPDYKMPPAESKLSLDETEIAILTKWIEQGAPWKPHWSFIPPERPDLPKVQQSEWPKNSIDYFILAKLEKEGLRPNSPADKDILLRRVSLDLTGLPPSVAKIDSFLADNAPDAYEKIVDQLLASTQYGENMTVDWLDLARYADTHGYQSDFYRPHWPWRDWVIEAFNKNMRYDDFVSWQLAGDLLPNATREQIVATGFNRNHPQNNEGGIVEEEFRVEYVADRTQTFSTAFLGLTMQCARCHDHKYDPIKQKEFYQMFAFFNNQAESGQTTFYQPDLPGPTLLLPEEDVAKQIAYIQQLTGDKENEIVKYNKDQLEAFINQPARLPRIKDKIRGQVAHYPLEQVHNNRVPNKVVGGKSGKIIDPVSSKEAQDPPQSTEGKVGKALIINGDDALSFPGVGRFTRADPFSIGLWVKIPNELKHGVIFHSNKGSAIYTYKGYQVSVEDGFFDVRIAHNFPYNAIHLISVEQIPREEWIHLMLTYDGSSKAAGTRLYLNGVTQKMDVRRDNLYKDIVFHHPGGSGKSPVVTHLKVGARWRGKGFTNGQVDEIRVFDRELTGLEVLKITGNSQFPELLKKDFSELTETERDQLFEYYSTYNDPGLALKLQELTDLRNQQNLLVEPIFEVMVMDEMTEPRQAFILQRGAYDQPLEAVDPGTLAKVLSFSEDLMPNRLGLAQWLFHPKNPLPSRVTVNRFWQRYFGIGLVRTADDFGSQGERPSHPQLLDWLATEFIDSGWNIKQMQKTLVMSASYRQSSLVDSTLLMQDPENRLIARGPSARLSAEMMRDLALAASGLLVKKIGGPSVKPYQPEGLWAFNAFSGKYEQDHGDDLYRRSLYTFWKRTNPPPSMNIFDAPSRAYCVVKREKTATPLQALVLMNDPQFLEASRVLAERIISECGSSVENKITLGYRLLTGRHPSTQEIELLTDQYHEVWTLYSKDQKKASSLAAIGEFPNNKLIDKTELAAYSQVMSTIMNFDATTMKR